MQDYQGHTPPTPLSIFLLWLTVHKLCPTPFTFFGGGAAGPSAWICRDNNPCYDVADEVVGAGKHLLVALQEVGALTRTVVSPLMPF